MKPEDFKSPQAGRVVRVSGGAWAFVPKPPPPPVTYDEETVLLLSRADAALSELSGLGRHLPNPHLLIAPYIRREAVLSSRIEGTRTNLSELLLEELEPGTGTPDADDAREVRNYVLALEHGIRRLKSLPLSLRLVREVHEKLMHKVRGGQADPGEFRRTQNWIGPPGSTMVTATYVPPPVDELQALLSAWEKFAHRRDTMPDLVQCAVLHQNFEAIHPFIDGNGRIGRLFITLFLIERERLSQPLLYLSQYFEATRQKYYVGLQRVHTHGEWSDWIRYFVTGVFQTASEAVQRAARLMDIREKLRRRLVDKPKALMLLDQLFMNPYVTVPRAAQLLKCSQPTARQAVAMLEKVGLLGETTGRSWRRVYVAKPILSAIEKRST